MDIYELCCTKATKDMESILTTSNYKDNNAYIRIHVRLQARLFGDRTSKQAPKSTRFSNISGEKTCLFLYKYKKKRNKTPKNRSNSCHLYSEISN